VAVIKENLPMNDKEQRLLDFLLADFNAIKSEIARRSNLQKAVIAAMLAFYTWLFQRSLGNGLELSLVVLVWVVSFFGYTFYLRESAEIKRLGWTIKEKIGKPTGVILSRSTEEVIPSEAGATELPEGSWRPMISTLFQIFLYLIAPLYFAATYLWKGCGT
jgi:hypothetical protein